ncbi:UNVERIFIED_CONTAM: hypothetical protein GTU68_035411 [Idotea baltica]|nr:hypothetical protein [Idotea baltica]
MIEGGKALYYLDAIAEHYPIVMHGVSLSIGGPHELDLDYLKKLKKLADHIQPKWMSDHVCWSKGSAHNLHDLLPIPFTEESLNYISTRVSQVQNILERPLVLENASSYIRAAGEDFSEWEFISALVEKTGCELLLDVNNVYVSSFNHGYDAWNFIQNLPAHKVRQIHLAGYSDYGNYLIDTHDHPITDPVWDLYQRTMELLGPISTMIERDDNFPPFGELLEELDKVRSLGDAAIKRRTV